MFWNDAYPSPSPTGRTLIVALVFGLFISFFLIFFEPFAIDVASGEDQPLALLGYGAITTIVLLVFLYLLPLFFPVVFSDKHWTLKDQLLLYFFILFVIATGNGLYTNYLHTLPFSWSNYWWMINRTFMLGGIPFSFLILLDYHWKRQHHHDVARQLQRTHRVSEDLDLTHYWTIKTELKNESFTFNDRDFSHAIADGNYIDIYSVTGASLRYTTYRISLSAFAKQLDAVYLQRCHRSYVVNLNKVREVSGNAQGLQLRLSDSEVVVPVSRKYVPQVRAFFAGNL